GKTRDVLQERRLGRIPSPRARLSSIPRDLNTIVMRCMAKTPAGRYASSAELCDDLHRFITREPIRARKVSAVETGWWWCRTHPVTALLASSLPLVLALVCFLLISQRNAMQLFRQTSEAITEKEEMKLRRHMVQLSQASRELADNNRLRAKRLLESIPPTLRDWEWQLLNLISESPSRSLVPVFERATYTSLVVAPKSHRLFTATDQGWIRYWRLSSPTEGPPAFLGRNLPIGPVTTLYRHPRPKPIECLAISPNEHWLAWIDRDGNVGCWNLLENELAQRIKPQTKIGGRIRGTGRCLSFSPDSKRLVVGGGSKAIETRPADQSSWFAVYELKQETFRGVTAKAFTGRAAINSVVFVDKEKFAFSRGAEPLTFDAGGYVEVWGVDGEMDRIVCRGRGMYGLDYNPAKNRLGWCDDAGTIYVCSLTNFRAIAMAQGTPRPANHARFTPSGEHLIVTSIGGDVARWRIDGGDPKEEGNADSDQPEPVEGSQAIADKAKPETPSSATTAKQPTNVEPMRLTFVRDHWGHDGAVKSAVFLTPDPVDSKDGPKQRTSRSRVVSCGENGKVLLWFNEDHNAIDRLIIRPRHFVDATWLSSKQIAVLTFASSGTEGIAFESSQMPNHDLDVELRKVQKPRTVSSLSPAGVKKLEAFHQPSTPTPPKYVLTCADTLYLCEAGNSMSPRGFGIPEQVASDAFFTTAVMLGDSHLLAAVSARKAPPKQAEKKSASITRVSQSAQLASAVAANSFQTYLVSYAIDGDEQPQVHLLPSFKSPVTCLGISPDGTRLAGGTREGEMFVLPVDSVLDGESELNESLADVWRPHLQRLSTLTWLDDTRIATASDDGTARIWNHFDPLSPSRMTADHNALKQTLYVSKGRVTDMAASADGTRLVTAGDDRVIRIWDSESGLELISLQPRMNQIRSVSFSPDDRHLLIVQQFSQIETIQLDPPEKETPPARGE
ncbi:MAG: hypothetical protein AAFV88_18325, partial [Planctomycetota bacterium]